MKRLKTLKRVIARPSYAHNLSARQLGFWMRFKHKQFSRLASEITNLGLTLGVVIVVLVAGLIVEAAITDESWKTPDEFIRSLIRNPWTSRMEFIQFLDDSVILGTIDGISIITALVLFIREGRREERREAHYAAWSMIDNAHGKETSYARFQALQDLNADSISLRGLDAPEADLMQIKLSGADLHQATLYRAKLRDADLRQARLDFANLEEADLQQVKLTNAGLFHATLTRVDFGGAELTKADLSNADLKAARFMYTNLSETKFDGADLEGATFEKVRYLTPEQVKRAKNWKQAQYDEDFQRQLGLIA
ncbi:MAG: pentapeptide repeat-containing protein [Cyanothece sp. SIO1E1]|nr:pentapeptide repeat-containing protein [Cyanothece sp. SIO1E1]